MNVYQLSFIWGRKHLVIQEFDDYEDGYNCMVRYGDHACFLWDTTGRVTTEDSQGTTIYVLDDIEGFYELRRV